MQQAEAELKAQSDALLERAKNTDDVEADEPELDRPAEIGRREVRLKTINEARQRLQQRQRDEHGNPKGGRYKCEFGVPEAKA